MPDAFWKRTFIIQRPQRWIPHQICVVCRRPAEKSTDHERSQVAGRGFESTKHQIGIDLLNLFDRQPRPDSAGNLSDKGWSTSVHTPFDYTRRHGRGPTPEPNDALAGNRWVFANKPGL